MKRTTNKNIFRMVICYTASLYLKFILCRQLIICIFRGVEIEKIKTNLARFSKENNKSSQIWTNTAKYFFYLYNVNICFFSFF